MQGHEEPTSEGDSHETHSHTEERETEWEREREKERKGERGAKQLDYSITPKISIYIYICPFLSIFQTLTWYSTEGFIAMTIKQTYLCQLNECFQSVWTVLSLPQPDEGWTIFNVSGSMLCHSIRKYSYNRDTNSKPDSQDPLGKSHWIWVRCFERANLKKLGTAKPGWSDVLYCLTSPR